MIVFRSLVIAAVVPLLFIQSALANPANPDVSFILDGFLKSENNALSGREKSFGLGHTELSLQSAVDDMFAGRLTTVLESHEGQTEVELEEAFLDTVSLPMGLSIRAGRFLSQVGYLNSRHTHSDNFAERPAAYRALLGAHYFDDGVRLNALMPTPFYWRLGAELFKGKQLATGEGDEVVGVYTLNTKFGGDISDSHSWQLGASYLHHKLKVQEEEGSHGGGHNHGGHNHGQGGHDHGHSHSAGYSGENLYLIDAVWKWAPQGNARKRQVILSAEYIKVDDLNEHATDDDIHKGWYGAVVYRFNPQWAVGFRQGDVELKEAHGDHFHDQNLEESDLMVSWSRSHFSTIRLQYTRQQGAGFNNLHDAVTLQYVMSLGAHGAHEF